MITGTHALIHSDHAEEICAFFRDILKFPAVDAGHGWLIFSLPPAEIGMHPAEKGSHYELYLMCDEIHATVADLEPRGVKFSSPITEARFGFVTSLTLPGGAELGLYQPKHPLAPIWASAAKKAGSSASSQTSKRKKPRPKNKRR